MISIKTVESKLYSASTLLQEAKEHMVQYEAENAETLVGDMSEEYRHITIAITRVSMTLRALFPRSHKL